MQDYKYKIHFVINYDALTSRSGETMKECRFA